MYLRAHWIPGQPGMTRKGKQPPKKSLKCRRSLCLGWDFKQKHGENVEGPTISSGTFSIGQIPGQAGNDGERVGKVNELKKVRRC